MRGDEPEPTESEAEVDGAASGGLTAEAVAILKIKKDFYIIFFSFTTYPPCGIQHRQSRISHPTAASVKYSRYSATHTNSKETSSRKWTSPHIATMDQKNNYIFETYTSKAFI